MTLKGIVAAIAAIFSIFAAILWFLSSRGSLKVKSGVSMIDIIETAGKQGRFSAWAAISATISAIVQSLLFFF
jgi:hypothetical protein